MKNTSIDKLNLGTLVNITTLGEVNNEHRGDKWAKFSYTINYLLRFNKAKHSNTSTSCREMNLITYQVN